MSFFSGSELNWHSSIQERIPLKLNFPGEGERKVFKFIMYYSVYVLHLKLGLVFWGSSTPHVGVYDFTKVTFLDAWIASLQVTLSRNHCSMTHTLTLPSGLSNHHHQITSASMSDLVLGWLGGLACKINNHIFICLSFTWFSNPLSVDFFIAFFLAMTFFPFSLTFSL